MTPAMIIPLAIGIIIGGLVMAWLSPNVRNPVLVGIVYYAGVILVVVGLVLLLFPVLAWLHAQLTAMFGFR